MSFKVREIIMIVNLCVGGEDGVNMSSSCK